jgi:CubicO group peptidase (beta-lactamase class C family)
MKKLLPLFLIAVMPFTLFSNAAGTAMPNKKKKPELPTTDLKQFEELCIKSLVDFNVPGMAIAVVKDGKVILSRGFGVKDVSTKQQVDAQTQFAIASNTKAFTSAALAMLVDQGKIKWDDPVVNYLPYFQMYDPYVTAQMTIRDLLCHRSGLDTFSGDLIWYGTTHNREEVIRRSRQLEPSFGFRAGYGYNNIHFIAAGEIVAAVSGMTWDAFVEQNILRPAGMLRANTSITAFTPASNKATPHNEVSGVNQPIDWVNWDNVGPAGSINASVDEMSRWLLLQLGKGTLDGRTYWKEARTFEMWENNTPKTVGKWQREHMPSRHFNGYGLGWELMEYGGRKVVSHGGGYDGMISKTVLVPEENLAFVILTNNINSLPSMLTFTLLDHFLKPTHQENWYMTFLNMRKDDIEGDQKSKEVDAAARKANTTPSLPLSQYAGTYHSTMYGDIEVRLENDQLKIDFKPTALFKGDLGHWHYDTFELRWTTKMMLPPGKVSFVVNAKGEVEEMRIEVINPDFDFSELKLLKKK